MHVQLERRGREGGGQLRLGALTGADHSARGATWRLNRSGRRWQPAARGVKWFQVNLTEQYRQLGIKADPEGGSAR